VKLAWCRVSLAPLRQENNDQSEMVSQLLFGELVEVIESEFNWTKIRTYFDNYPAWMDTKQLIYLSEKEANRWLDGISLATDLFNELDTPWGKQFVPRGSFLPIDKEAEFRIGNHQFKIQNQQKNNLLTMQDFALSYLNTPYLWGGKGPLGIDCSGFTQQVFRFIGIQLPRDAYQQEELGQEIDFEDQQLGDLAFFSNEKGKIIHVGIVLADYQIIHASGWVRIDEFKEQGIWNHEHNKLSHNLHSIKRI